MMSWCRTTAHSPVCVESVVAYDCVEWESGIEYGEKLGNETPFVNTSGVFLLRICKRIFQAA
ncbi:hypothetical protein A6B41_00710 [Mannheimia granulomatis]|nr:hypothetical protein A6B41_00710 [Mannheimia granulomatis]